MLCVAAKVVLIIRLPTPEDVYELTVSVAFFQNVSEVERFGFFQRQIQPFTVQTADECTIHAYHIVPLYVYDLNEAIIKLSEPSIPHVPSALSATSQRDASFDTPSFNLLSSDPNAVVILNLHGNAAHVFTSFRPQIYSSHLSISTKERPVHVITFDYRGFGLSTCSPTEEGIILDTTTIINFITDSLGIDPLRIILVGQSLGTAVAVAAVHNMTSSSDKLANPFRGIVLQSPFTSIPTLLNTYSIKGVIPPLLSPLAPYPRFQKWVISKIADRWDTASRVQELISNPRTSLDLSIVHARDDWEIPWREGRGVWDAAILGSAGSGGLTVLEGSAEAGEYETRIWESDNGRDNEAIAKKRVRWERIRYGGHNKVGLSEMGKRAVMRIVEKEA
ncbi:MAG: hypothetical protein Q9227_004957 [Pyrenula ochraceoflavens]